LSEVRARVLSMLARGLKLTSLRRDILAALSPGRGSSPDELRRRVATKRGLDPSSPRWPSFSVSFVRALRILEEKGALSLSREVTLFQKPCLSWVALTELGERERTRAAPQGEGPLGFLSVETSLLVDLAPRLSGASERELEALATLVSAERERRAIPSTCSEGFPGRS
jgi:hypothetical protein